MVPILNDFNGTYVDFFFWNEVKVVTQNKKQKSDEISGSKR